MCMLLLSSKRSTTLTFFYHELVGKKRLPEGHMDTRKFCLKLRLNKYNYSLFIKLV